MQEINETEVCQMAWRAERLGSGHLATAGEPEIVEEAMPGGNRPCTAEH